MTYNGHIGKNNGFFGIAHSLAAKRIIALIGTGGTSYPDFPTRDLINNQVIFYDYESLSQTKVINLPKFVSSNQQFDSHGSYVFVNAGDDRFYVILQADRTSGLLHDFGVWGSDIK
jgi:hypothetical protein